MIETRDLRLEFGDAPIQGLRPLGRGRTFCGRGPCHKAEMAGGSAPGQDQETGPVPYHEHGQGDRPSEGETEAGEFTGRFALEQRRGLHSGVENAFDPPGLLGLGIEDGPFHLGRIPFHPGAFERGERAGELVMIRLNGRALIQGRDLVGSADYSRSERARHLFRIPPGSLLGFVEQRDATGEVGEHFLAALLVFDAATTRFLELGPFAFEVFLAPFQLDQGLLGGGDLLVDLIRGRGGRVDPPDVAPTEGAGGATVPATVHRQVAKIQMIKSAHGDGMLRRGGRKSGGGGLGGCVGLAADDASTRSNGLGCLDDLGCGLDGRCALPGPCA